jgi:hypothetical protein
LDPAAPCHLGAFASCPDVDPPETTIIKNPPRITQRRTIRFRFRADQPGSTFECKLDDSDFSACTSPTRLSGLEPGRHKFSVRAIDLAGNVDPSPAKHWLRVLG